jgi:hypothetical protein
MNASFYTLPNGTLIVAATGRFRTRALPLVARVGDVYVEGISTSPDGSGFTGKLPTTPRGGDELVVRYPPEPELRTGVRFPSLPVA